jgi:hypothetical protein
MQFRKQPGADDSVSRGRGNVILYAIFPPLHLIFKSPILWRPQLMFVTWGLQVAAHRAIDGKHNQSLRSYWKMVGEDGTESDTKLSHSGYYTEPMDL